MSGVTFRSRPFARKFPSVIPRCYVMFKVLSDPLYAALLDVLQYLPREAQEKMLMSAAARVSASGVLVIRNAMAGSCRRAAFTRATDKLAYWWGWMGTVPRDYPDRTHIAQALASHGLQ